MDNREHSEEWMNEAIESLIDEEIAKLEGLFDKEIEKPKSDKITLRQLLKELGATDEDGTIWFDAHNPILDVYPQTVVDGGDWKPVNARDMISASTHEAEDGKLTVYLWRNKI